MAQLLPYEAYYENSRGEVLRLDSPPYIMTESRLFDAEWSFTSSVRPLGEGGRLLAAKRSRDVRTMSVSVIADTAAELSARLERMAEIFDYDVAARNAGRLWINGQYMTCWCSAREKELSCDFVSDAVVKVSIYPETPVWCREVECGMEPADGEEGLKYAYSYPYRYGDNRRAAMLVNTHFAPCPMRITFYGPANCPAVYINGGRIGVDIALTDGECAVIDQASKEVCRIDAAGNKTSCFNARVKNGLSFEYLPPGESAAVLDSEGAVGITLIEQRSEPTWALS